MQEAGNSLLSAAVNEDRRTIVYELKVDWNRNGLYDHALSDLTDVIRDLRIDRDMLKLLPQETTMAEGYYAAALNIRLGGTRPGDSDSIAALMSPWRTDSPLFGVDKSGIPVRVKIGHRLADGSVVTPTQFTGVISEPRVSSRTMEVTISCLDPAEDLSANVSLPLYALPEDHSGQAYTINSQWVIDYILRRNGKYMTPPTHSRAIWAATMHGSMIPEIGHQTYHWTGSGTRNADDPVSWPGRPGWGLGYGGATNYKLATAGLAIASPFVPRAGRSISFQAQLDSTKAPLAYQAVWAYILSLSTNGGFMSGATFVMKYSTSGSLGIEIYKEGVKLHDIQGPFLGVSGWVDAWFRVDIGVSMASSTIQWCDGSSTAVNLSALSDSTFATYPFVCNFAEIPCSDMHICNATDLAAGATIYDVDGWVPQVDLDPGLNELTGIPLRRNVESWSLLKEVVGAEFGVIGHNEQGRLFFQNRDNARRHNLTVDQVLTREKELSEFGMTERAGSIRNVITGGPAARRISRLTTAKGWSVVYDSTDITDFLCPPGTSQFDVVISDPEAIVNRATMAAYTTAQWNDTATQTDHGFVATVHPSGAAIGNVGITLLPLNPQTLGPDLVRVFVVNANDFQTIRLATADGQPALRIQGRAYSFAPALDVSMRRASSVAKFGERSLEVPASDWHQTPEAFNAVANSLLRDLQRPIPVPDQITAVGDCRRQLQDVVQVSDEGFLGGPMLASVVGLSRTLTVEGSGAKLTDVLTIRPFAAPGQWILGHPEWSILGVTTQP